MKNRLRNLTIMLTVLAFSLGVVCLGVVAAQTTEKTTEKTADKACDHTAQATEEELAASVPALKDLHEVVYPLWHTAYPDKDYALIKELLPQADELTAKLDEAKLPGILRDKQADWDKGKAELKSSLQQLHAAVEKDNQEEMLKQLEAFHSNYEKLVRTIRPLTPELDAFHQELYKLYHFYGPQYDLAQIRTSAAAMQAKIEPLKKSQLQKRLADRQKDFDAAVVELEGAVAGLIEVAKTDDKEKILAAVETAHSAYVKIEGMFD